MKRHSLLHIVSIILLLSSICFFSSCNEEEIESFETEVPASTHTCRMTFDVDFTVFDAQDGSTRASIHGWDDGDIVYLSFTTSSNGTVGGSAIYDASNNDWTVTYTGNLSSTEQGSVKVYYYDGEVTKSGNTLSIDPTVGVYADLKGSYKYSRENGVNVSASLSPQTSRIRFKGESGKNIVVSGIKSYTEYDQQSGALTATPISSSVTVSSEGYTPYIYGVFADSSKPSISINHEGCRFTKDCNSSVFQIGVSGWMNVPTRAAHDNWEMEDRSEAHAVLTDTDKDGVSETLIFYYDDVDHSQEGMVFELNEENQNPGWYEYNENITNVIFDPGFADAKPTSTSGWFVNCSKLINISGIKYLDTSDVTDMEWMFGGCSSLTSLDVSGFDTSAAKVMYCMFFYCSSLTNLDLSSFNTAAVINMGGMFIGCSNLTSLDVRSFDTSKVTDMANMFSQCSSLTTIDVGNFNTAAVTDMGGMFSECSSLTTIDVSNFNTAAVTDMHGMFSHCSSLATIDVRNFKTAAVTNMHGMFCECSSLTTLDVRSFNTSAVKDMSLMFVNCHSLANLTLSSFNTVAVTNMAGMFEGCYRLTSLDLSGFNTAAVKDMRDMFWGCSGLTSLNLSSFKTAAVTDMSFMFFNCSSLTTIDVSGFDTSSVAFMSGMFNYCYSLSNLDLSGFNTNKVTDMSNMFHDCSSLTSLDVSNFNTAVVTDMRSMFHGCLSLTSLDISNFDITAQTNVNCLCMGCYKLSNINLGSNDFSENDDNINQPVFSGVGNSESPCDLIINADFDKSVLGVFYAGWNHYRWRGGYFAEPTIQN